jgi:hypothetical protein
MFAAPGIASLGFGLLVLAFESATSFFKPFLASGLLGAISVPIAVAILVKGEHPSSQHPLGLYGKVLLAAIVFAACAGELLWTVVFVQVVAIPLVSSW